MGPNIGGFVGAAGVAADTYAASHTPGPPGAAAGVGGGGGLEQDQETAPPPPEDPSEDPDATNEPFAYVDLEGGSAGVWAGGGMCVHAGGGLSLQLFFGAPLKRSRFECGESDAVNRMTYTIF